MRRWSFSAIAGLVLSVSASAHGESPSAKGPGPASPPPSITQRTLDQLGEILTPLQDAWPSQRHPPGVPSALWYVTRPRSGSQAGVCISSTVIFYLRAGQSIAGADDTSAALKVADLSVSPRFHLDHPVDPQRTTQVGQDQALLADQACARKDPRVVRFFTASDEFEAVRGAWGLAALVKAAKGDNPSFRLSCRDGAKTCRSSIAQATTADMTSAQACSPNPHVSPYGMCSLITLSIKGGGDYSVEVRFDETAKPLSAVVWEESVLRVESAG